MIYLHIAIVEDEKDSTSILIEHLSVFSRENNIDMQYRQYTNGMDFISSYQPIWDLLLLDIEMPLMDGHRLTKLIKTDDELKHIPVILFSSLISDELRIKGQEVGADEQITKPEIVELVSIIDRLI